MLAVNENELDRLLELLRSSFGGLDNGDNGISETGFLDVPTESFERGVSTDVLVMRADVGIDCVHRLAAAAI